MTRSEGDQQEIVLGNKQLLSIFFIIVVLMGVSFTIGYVIGRNASSVSAATGAGLPPVSVRPSAAPPTSAEPATSDSKAETTQSEPAVERGSKQAAARAQPDAPATVRTAKADAPPPARAAEEEATPARPVSSTNGTGTYLQVASLRKDDASKLVEMLQGRKFPALLGESPKEGLFRVLIGPYRDNPSLAEAKQKLRGAGFDPIIAK